jgi:hypothetical protein
LDMEAQGKDRSDQNKDPSTLSAQHELGLHRTPPKLV